ncbi:MAG: hypothetical protein JWO81_2548 [Alphaproteobacteria bacterium]|nr:hypothetical protein [Alphaproteobacteria bacterium]
MASGLSLIIEVRGIPDINTVAGLVGGAAAATPGNPLPLPPTGPQILHYVWGVDLTALIPPKVGDATLLLSTVYDEAFEPYIRDLVLANPKPFNDAAGLIVGLEDLTPVQNNLPAFIDFVRKNDLTHGGTTPFSEAYTWSVSQIVGALGSGWQPSDGGGQAGEGAVGDGS